MSSNPPGEAPSDRVARAWPGWVRPFSLLAIVLLYVLSVPWYREPGAAPKIWFGLPDWVFVAVVCYVGVALFNGLAWLATDVVDEPEDEDDPETSR